MRSEDIRLRLKEHRGRDLVSAIADELASLHDQLEQVRAELRGTEAYTFLRDRLGEVDKTVVRNEALPRLVQISAAENLTARDGFYAVEYTADGSPYRWTGPGRVFTFRTFIDRSAPVRLGLQAVSSFDVKRQAALSLTVDGAALECAVTPLGNSLTVEAVIPPRSVDTGDATDIVFVLPYVGSNESLGDNRILGIAFRILLLEAVVEEPPQAQPVAAEE